MFGAFLLVLVKDLLVIESLRVDGEVQGLSLLFLFASAQRDFLTQALLNLGLCVALMFFVVNGHHWARVILGVTLFIAISINLALFSLGVLIGYFILNAMGFAGLYFVRLTILAALLLVAGTFVGIDVQQSFYWTELRHLDPGAQSTLGAAVAINILVGWLMYLSPPIRAYVWFKSNQHLSLLIPGDDSDWPGSNPGSLVRGLGALFSGLVMIVMILAAVAAAAYLYGIPMTKLSDY